MKLVNICQGSKASKLPRAYTASSESEQNRITRQSEKGTLTSIAHQYAEQHCRIRSPTLVASLNRTCNRGDDHVNHKDSQYYTGQFVFPPRTSGWFRQIRPELDQGGIGLTLKVCFPWSTGNTPQLTRTWQTGGNEQVAKGWAWNRLTWTKVLK